MTKSRMRRAFWGNTDRLERRYHDAVWCYYRNWSYKRLRAELAALEPPAPDWSRPRRARRHIRAWVIIGVMDQRRGRSRGLPEPERPAWLVDQWAVRPNEWLLGESGLKGRSERENIRLDWDLEYEGRTAHCLAMRDEEYYQWFAWWWTGPEAGRVLHPSGPYKEIRDMIKEVTVSVMVASGMAARRAS